jgi:hypothetical protein
MARAMPPGKSNPSHRLALLVFLGALLANILSLLVALSTYGHQGSYLATPLGEIAGFIFPTSLLSAGYLLRSRRPGNAIGWLFLAFGVVATISSIGWMVMLVEFLPTGDARLGAIVSWLGLILSVPTWSYLLVALVVRFPDGQPATAAAARLLRWLPVVVVVVGVVVALRPGTLLIYTAFENPLATPASLHPALSMLSSLAAVSLLIPFAIASGSMVRRYRRAASIERLQLRWFAYGAGIVLVASAVYVILGIVVDASNEVVREATYALFVASLTVLPVAVFQATASHRLYDIDRIIGRTVAYGALTAILAGLYSASIRLFNWLFVDLTGQESEVALVLTTLILATSFTPIKTWLEKGAAKRFRFAEADAPAMGAGMAGGPAGPDGGAGPVPSAIPPSATLPGAMLPADAMAALEARLEARIDEAVRLAVDRAVAAAWTPAPEPGPPDDAQGLSAR